MCSRGDHWEFISKIDKFNGEDFYLWKYEMQLAFRASRVLAVVEGTEKREEADDKDAWDDKDCLAVMLICSAVDKKHLQQLMMCKTSAQMWSRLTMLHQQNDRYVLLEQFWTYQMQEGDDITSHVSAVETMARQIEDLGEKPSDGAITFMILCSLPPSYTFLRDAWESVPEEQQTVEALTRRLLKKESQDKTGSDEEEAADKAFFAAKIGFGGSKLNNATIHGQKKHMMDRIAAVKKNAYCYFCHEKGHWERACEKRKQTEENNVNSRNDGVPSSAGTYPQSANPMWLADFVAATKNKT